MASSRYLYKFESVDAAYSFTFPEYSYEYEPAQEYRTDEVLIMNKDFPLDLLKSQKLPIGNTDESASFVTLNDSLSTLDTNIDAMKAALYNGAYGYIYTIGADGSIRRAEGRLKSKSLSLSNNPYTLPTSINFSRYSHWGVANAINVNQAITADGQTFVVNNPGNVVQRNLVITLVPNTAAGIVNPIITNTTLVDGINYIFATTRDSAATTSRIKLDTRDPSVKWSTNSGTSYADDFPLYVIQATQIVLTFALAPGNNTLRYNGGGTPNLQVQIVADSAYL